MNKNILVGSILTVALLLLVSLSNVVGYQSVKSDIKTSSPLFSIRNNKGDVSSDYLGKGNTINLLLHKRDNEIEVIDSFIDVIKLMDDETFDEFVNRFIDYINQKNFDNLKISTEEIENAFYEIRDNPEILKNIYTKISPKTNTYYIPHYCSITYNNTPLCYLIYTFIFIFFLIIMAIMPPIILLSIPVSIALNILVLILYIPFIVLIILDKLFNRENLTNLNFPLI